MYILKMMFTKVYYIDIIETIFELTDEEVAELNEAWARAGDDARQRRIREFENMGGTPGIVNVMFNGSFIEFTGAVPETTDGSAFIPARPFFETIGAAASYDGQNQTVTAIFSDKSFAFVVGQDVMSITDNDTARQQSLNGRTYTKNGSFYIPIRAVAEALGYSIFWDYEFSTIVIIDTKAIIEEIDRDYAFLNRLLNMPDSSTAGDDGTYLTTLAITALITVIDSPYGSMTFDAGTDMTIHSDGRNFYCSGSADLSGLMLLILFVLDSSGEDLSELPEILSVITSIRDDGVDVIMNVDEGILYIKAPFLSSMEPEIPADAWIAIGDLSGYTEETAFGVLMDEIESDNQISISSVGAMIVSEYLLISTLNPYGNFIHLYNEIMEVAGLCKAMFGDDKFVIDGNEYTLIISSAELFAGIMAGADETLDAALLAEFSVFEEMFDIELSVTFRIDDDNVERVTGRFFFSDGHSEDSDYQEVKCILEFDVGLEYLNVSFELYLRDVASVRVEISLSTTTAETNVPVPSRPPEGATIIAFEDLIEPQEYESGEPVMPVSFTP